VEWVWWCEGQLPLLVVTILFIVVWLSGKGGGPLSFSAQGSLPGGTNPAPIWRTSVPSGFYTMKWSFHDEWLTGWEI